MERRTENADTVGNGTAADLTPPARFGGLQTAFSLPRFAPSCTLALSRQASGSASGTFAQALMEEGILQSSDWQGNLADSIQHALVRWVNADLKLDQLKIFDLSFVAVDCIEGAGAYRYFEPQSDKVREMVTKQNRFGGLLSLEFYPFGDMPALEVGGSILRLEKHIANLGFACLDRLEHSLQRTLDGVCVTPQWAYHYVCEQWEMVPYEDLEEDAEAEGLTPEQVAERFAEYYHTPDMFVEKVPSGVWEINWIEAGLPKLMQQALRKPGLPAKYRDLLHEIRVMGEMFDKMKATREAKYNDPFTNPFDNHYYQYPVVPLFMVWSREDTVARAGDDYIEGLQQGDWCEQQITETFFGDSIPSIREAIKRFRTKCEVLLQIDRVLTLLNCRQSQALINILSNEPEQVAARENAFEAAEQARLEVEAQRVRVRV